MEERYKSGKVASILGIVGNIFLLVIKTFAGFITNSQAMISDALNSAGDIFSSIFTFIGNKLASRKPDDDHNLGHGKAEYIFSLLISVVIMGVSVRQGINSVYSIFNESKFIFSWILVLVCIITIITKFSLYLYVNKLSKKYNNILLRANAEDHRNDCVLTSLNLLSAVLSYFGVQYVDGIVGFIVSIWILIVGVRLFIDSYDVLMDKGMNDETQDKIIKIVSTYDEIKKYNHLNSTPVGYQYQISITIFVDGNLSTFESHEIANRLEKEIMKLDEVYLAVIHVNPYE